MSDALPFTRKARIPRLLGVGNYLNNYFPLYLRLRRSIIREELVSLALLRIKIIKIIILLCINI